MKVAGQGIDTLIWKGRIIYDCRQCKWCTIVERQECRRQVSDAPFLEQQECAVEGLCDALLCGNLCR